MPATAQILEPLPPEAPRLRPFGLTKAVPVAALDAAQVAPVLSLCAERQVSVTEDGTPFVDEPSMKSAFETNQETREDHQPDVLKENDTD